MSWTKSCRGRGKVETHKAQGRLSAISKPMHGFIGGRVVIWFIAMVAAGTSLLAQQDPFRWMDFHSQKDQDVVVWVTRSLEPEKWTAIREIGVQYDAALVITTLRATSESTPSSDTFTVWSVSLVNHSISPVLKGVNLRLLDSMTFADGRPPELAALYDDCSECAAGIYFTAFHYDVSQHGWAARWMRGGQAVPVWTANEPAAVALTQVYAVMAEPDGRGFVGTWNHFDYGNQKPAEDFIYQYDVDPFRSLERTQLLSGKDADAMKQQLCRAQDAHAELARGQEGPLCQQVVKPRVERKPVTTPPANNHGQSAPPGSRK